jgi:hypothetical protein
MTLANTKGIDILLSNQALNQLYKIEVKTTDRKPIMEKLFSAEPCYGWPMGGQTRKHHGSDLVLLLCSATRSFIVPSACVASYVCEQHRYWLRTRRNPVAETPMRRFRIPVSGPLAFENNWRILAGGKIPARQVRLSDPWFKPARRNRAL